MRRESSQEYDIANIPTYTTGPIYTPTGEEIPGYVRVIEPGTMTAERTISVMSARYSLVQHRRVAEIAHSVLATLDKPDTQIEALRANPHFSSQKITIFSGGRKMEFKGVVGQKFRLASGEEFYPGLRITNSLDGTLAVAVSGFALRIACTNQLYAGMGSLTDVRELHVSAEEEILGAVQKGVWAFLDSFQGVLDTYAGAMNNTIKANVVQPSLVERGLPVRHAKAIQDAVFEVVNRQYALSTTETPVSRWDAYNCATDYLTHKLQVNPDRTRQFERIAAAAILVPSEEATLALADA